MRWDENGFVTVHGTDLECISLGPPPDQAPTLVLLHEGLGSCHIWRDLPRRLAQETGCGVFAYSRAGYGASDPARLPLPVDFLERHAAEVLPALLQAIRFQSGFLIGHSDGASIAAAYLGQQPDERITGACLIAPHFFTEPLGLRAIAAAKQAFAEGPLRDRLKCHHLDVDSMFKGWNDIWLNPQFASWNMEHLLPAIKTPILAIQGADDQYGTLAQIDSLQKHLPVPPTVHILNNCKHTPHLEQPEATLAAITRFIRQP